VNQGRPVSDGDRLPWLEPYREPRTKPSKGGTKRGRGPGLVILGLAGAGLLALGGYWLGRSDAPRSIVTAPLPPSTTVPPRIAYRTLDDRLTDSAEAEQKPEAKVLPRKTSRPRSRIVRATPNDAQLAAVRQSQEAAPARPATPPPAPRVVIVPTAPPTAAGRPGQAVYLGNFGSPALADAAYDRIVARYPYLGTLPRAISPNPLSGGRRTYQLRIGAGSRRNAKALCKNLVSIGRGCTVV